LKESGDATSAYRPALGHSTTYDFFAGPGHRIWDGGYTSVAVLSGTTRLNGSAINGTLVDRPQQAAILSVVTSTNTAADMLGHDRIYDYQSWWGDVAELIIYDRPLTSSERTSVEQYLASRYGITLP